MVASSGGLTLRVQSRFGALVRQSDSKLSPPGNSPGVATAGETQSIRSARGLGSDAALSRCLSAYPPEKRGPRSNTDASLQGEVSNRVFPCWFCQRKSHLPEESA